MKVIEWYDKKNGKWKKLTEANPHDIIIISSRVRYRIRDKNMEVPEDEN